MDDERYDMMDLYCCLPSIVFLLNRPQQS